MGTASKQFILLLWKNFIQTNNIIIMILQIIFPILFIIALFGIKQSIKLYKNQEIVFEKFSLTKNSLFYTGSQLDRPWYLFYSPSILETNAIMRNVKKNMGDNFKIKNMENSTQLDYYCRFNDTIVMASFACISFSLDKNDTYKISYDIKFPAEQHWRSGDRADWLTGSWYEDTMKGYPRSNSRVGHITQPGYFREGMPLLQYLIDQSISSLILTEKTAKNKTKFQPQLRNFPFPAFSKDDFVDIIRIYMPLFILVCFVINAVMISVNLTQEKEKKLKESMRLMGLKVWVNWLVYFFQNTVLMIFSILIMTFFLHIKTSKGAIFNFSDPSVTFVFFFLFSVSIICYAFLISSLFAKANVAAACSAIIYLLSYVPYYFIQIHYEHVPLAGKILISFFNNICMAFGCLQFARFEELGVGLQWSNLNDFNLAQDDMTMATVFIILIVDIIIYSILIWYFDSLFPGDFGVAMPFYFPFTKWYWFGHHPDPPSLDQIGNLPDKFEEPEKNKPVGVRIRGLTKIFNKGQKPAVNDLNLDIYSGLITAFLGHNGAGKTTTMFMLTGFLKPTKGKMYINGFDLSKEMEKVRRNLGLCPQHNILFDRLNVEQHLKFFAKLKGTPDCEVIEEVDKFLKVLHLENKRFVQAKALSGGMKRKLSIAIAFIGGSKFVILDEPTSGMDPESRRQTWEMLQEQRKGRTILLSTHFMDEADLLGDKIAIMASGSIQCYGSSIFLKNKYGIGYHLTIAQTPDCDPSILTELIFKTVENSKFESELGNELTYLLPKDQTKKIAKLFKILETSKEKLGIESFGASVTTMEEVFIKVSEQADSNVPLAILDETFSINSPQIEKNHDISKFPLEKVEYGNEEIAKYKEIFFQNLSKEKKFITFFSRVESSLSKKIITSKRSFFLLLFQFSLPLIFVILACLAIYSTPKKTDPPKLKIDFPSIKTHWEPKFITPVFVNNLDSNNYNVSAFWDCINEEIGNKSIIVDVNKLNEYRAKNKLILFGNITDYLLFVSKKNIFKYKRNYLMAIQLDVKNKIIEGLFQDEAFHAMPLALNKINNIILCEEKSHNKTLLNKTISIITYNAPYPWNPKKKLIGINTFNNLWLFAGSFSNCLTFGLGLMVGAYILFILYENYSGAKLNQYLSGANPATFWFTTFICDFCLYLIPVVTIVIVVIFFKTEGYIQSLGYVVLLLLLFFWSMIFIIYCLSLVKMSPSNGYIIIAIINIFTGTIGNLAISIMKYPTFKISNIAFGVEWLFYTISPAFSLNKGLLDLYLNYKSLMICDILNQEIMIYNDYDNGNYTFNQFCENQKEINVTNPCCLDNCDGMCLYRNENYLSMERPGIGISLVFMTIQGLIGFIFLFLYEYSNGFSILKLKKKNNNYSPSSLSSSSYLSPAKPLCQQSSSSSKISNDYNDYKMTTYGKFLQTPQKNKNISLYKEILDDSTRPSISDTSGNSDISAGYSSMVTCDLDSMEKPNKGQAPLTSVYTNENQIKDKDVMEEQEKVEKVEGRRFENFALVLKNVIKYYGKFKAVDDISLAVSKGECFGLLGVNGAGKTTTFKLMIGEYQPTNGEIFITGINVLKNPRKAQSMIGYCPQFDALIEQLTVSETLEMYGKLRGIQRKQLKTVVQDLINVLTLSGYEDKKAGQLSGGNKRKLSIAIALIGNPPIIFLDEPTTGMDPAARRKLWNVLSAVRETGKTIILTSHSMEECEALCTRLAIMVNGKFECMGSPQHLKSKYGAGYTVIVKMKQEKKINDQKYYSKLMISFMSNMFPKLVLKDQHQYYYHFQVSGEKVTWDLIFHCMEKMRDPFHLEDYSVSQTTLEEIFIFFAKKQNNEK